MRIRSLILATVASLALAGAAYAQPSPTCLTGSILDGPFENGPRCEVQQTMNSGTGGRPMPVAAPVPDAPVIPDEPTEPAPGVHPDHPEGGGIEVTFVGTVFEGFPAGTYTQIFAPIVPQYNFPGGVIDAVVRPDGTATVWVISYGLPGQG